MPGIFGGIGCRPECLNVIRREHSAIWGEIECHSVDGAMLGGHAHTPARSVWTTARSTLFAVDGDKAIYEGAHRFAEEGAPELFRIDSSRLTLLTGCRGNVAALDLKSGSCFLAVEPLGAYPLYYSRVAGGLMFSSLLRPLARALSYVAPLELDQIAIIELLQADYMLAGRSHFRGIRRLMPGQTVKYDQDSESLVLSEASDLWSASEGGAGARTAELCWERLQQAVHSCFDDSADTALMFSAGWDSRTLLAAMRAHPGLDRLVCYVHGDLQSRELAIAGRICRDLEVRFTAEPLVSEVYSAERLEHVFARTESVDVNWEQASRILKGFGVGCITSGVYGEVLGGHYGSVMLMRGIRQLTGLASELIPRPRRPSPQGSIDLDRLVGPLTRRNQKRPFHLRPEVWEQDPLIVKKIESDVRAELQRLVRRGVRDDDALVEAFITEHRGAQYASAQMRSCRANVDVAMPFTDVPLARLASAICHHDKVVNSLNRQMLRKYAPKLCAYPTSATLVPASWPISTQEASRFVRRSYERTRWQLYSMTNGAVSFPHFGWWQFEFLSDGEVFHSILDSLQADLWDRAAVAQRIDANSAGASQTRRRSESSLLLQDMLRMAGVDLALRSMA